MPGNYTAFFAYGSSFFAIISYTQIIISIIKGKTFPSKTTWIIWGVNDLLIFFSSYAGGARNTAILPATCVVCGIACLIVSAKYDALPLSRLDRFCLFTSISGWILWQLSSQPILGLVVGVLVNTVGAFPTWAKCYKEPRSHELLPWITFLFASYFALFSAEEMTASKLLFPINSSLVSTISFLLIWWPRKSK